MYNDMALSMKMIQIKLTHLSPVRVSFLFNNTSLSSNSDAFRFWLVSAVQFM